MSKEQELPALPPPPLWHDGVEFKGYTKTPGPGPWWTADCMREYARDAIAALASPAAEPVPNPWRELFWQVALALKCLPSSYTDGNAHVLRAAARAAEPAQAPSDDAVDLAAALEIRAILEQIKEVATIYPPDDMPTPFQSAWRSCCEEIFYRATGCQWHFDEDDGKRGVSGATAGQRIVEAALASPPATKEAKADAVLRALDDLGDDAAVHIWPDDLEKCSRSECVVEVYSVRYGSPDGETVPLFSREQVAQALRVAPEGAA